MEYLQNCYVPSSIFRKPLQPLSIHTGCYYDRGCFNNNLSGYISNTSQPYLCARLKTACERFSQHSIFFCAVIIIINTVKSRKFKLQYNNYSWNIFNRFEKQKKTVLLTRRVLWCNQRVETNSFIETEHIFHDYN